MPASTSQIKQKQPTTRNELGVVGTMVGAFGAAFIIGIVALAANYLSHHFAIGTFTFAEWPADVGKSPVAALRWFLGDMTEAQFYKSDLAALGMVAGAMLAWQAQRKGKRWGGSALSYGSGLWPWMFTAAALSLLLSNLAFGWTLGNGWQPTFVPFVSVASALVLVYGPGWKVCLTGAILGAFTTTPIALLLIAAVTGPSGLPAVVANVLAMSIAAAAVFLLARKLPWLSLPPAASTPPAGLGPASIRPSNSRDAKWAARRVLSDFTEAPFIANELASIGIIVGVCLAFIFNPELPGYGSRLIPHILFGQALTSAVGIVLWRRWYRNGGWTASYVSLVSAVPAAILAFDGTWVSILASAILGAILGAPVARYLSKQLPKDFHPFIGNTLSMAITTVIVLPVVGYLNGLLS